MIITYLINIDVYMQYITGVQLRLSLDVLALQASTQGTIALLSGEYVDTHSTCSASLNGSPPKMSSAAHSADGIGSTSLLAQCRCRLKRRPSNTPQMQVDLKAATNQAV